MSAWRISPGLFTEERGSQPIRKCELRYSAQTFHRRDRHDTGLTNRIERTA